jgi:hypothetical protein
MKEVILHWVEMEKWEVPDECPTDDYFKFAMWILKNDPEAVYREKKSSRDYEIIEVNKGEKDNDTNTG